MVRSLRLRARTDGRGAALMHLRFVVNDDGSVDVRDGERVVDRHASFARALTTYGLRRTELEYVATN